MKHLRSVYMEPVLLFITLMLCSVILVYFIEHNFDMVGLWIMGLVLWSLLLYQENGKVVGKKKRGGSG